MGAKPHYFLKARVRLLSDMFASLAKSDLRRKNRRYRFLSCDRCPACERVIPLST